ncbi:DEAD/DEAH box helicase [Pseudoruegeria sp. SK021]|uniref:DEAD/DEAH box helicase n=1 Tax=Pseudoruegeria sp. SK021 TaxID=1933035 RepID=UPI000A24EAF2|nr:DEAD/DEAH box helicase [Pseudoruegeria sp. SK021]OSP56632.1 DEAD/DEAH box helicase [Pseudoruegeria sp. SK021]
MDFDMLGLAPRLVAKLAEQGIKTPTPIQTQAIPHAMNGRDVLGLAQTGTGKTAAFGLPLVHALSVDGTRPDPKTVRGLILAPTRELAKQISDNLRAYTEGSHLKVALVVGGAGIVAQVKRLEKGVDLLVATPGRLLDLLDRRAVRLDQTRFLVLDEADQMLDLGFIHALRKIAPLLAKERQTMLFSATMPKQMAELAQAYLTDPVRVEVSPPGKAADKVTQAVHFVTKGDKTDLLIKLLGKHRSEMALVFSRTKHGADRLSKSLERAGFDTVAIHGNRSQGQRERAISAFKAGQIKVLVATDVAARGIDIPGVRHVYNFDLPNVAENYIHRIGRTARAGADGAAVAFCAPDEMGELRDIEKVMKISIPVAGGTPWQIEAGAKKGRSGGGGGGGGGAGGAGNGQRRRRPGGAAGGQRRKSRQAA